MRFGLSDLEDLPSLKEFEALAREALGTEDGVAESAPAAESADAGASDAASVTMDGEKPPDAAPLEAAASEQTENATSADIAEPSEKAAGSGAS